MRTIQTPPTTESGLALYLYDSAVQMHRAGTLSARSIVVERNPTSRPPSDFTFIYWDSKLPKDYRNSCIGLATLERSSRTKLYFGFHAEECFSRFYQTGRDPYYCMADDPDGTLKDLRTGKPADFTQNPGSNELSPKPVQIPSSNGSTIVSQITGKVYDISTPSGLALFNDELRTRLEIQAELLRDGRFYSSDTLADPSLLEELQQEIKRRMAPVTINY